MSHILTINPNNQNNKDITIESNTFPNTDSNNKEACNNGQSKGNGDSILRDINRYFLTRTISWVYVR